MADKTTVQTVSSEANGHRRGARPPPPALSLRGRIPALTAAHAQALRGFFSKRHSWLLADNGLMQLLPGRPTEAGQTFELDAEGVRLGLRLQATAVAVGDGLHWSDFQGPSRILAWSLAHEHHLMRLSEAMGVALTPLLEAGDGSDDGQARDTVWLEFLIDDEHPENDPDAARRAPALHGSIRLPATWLERLLSRAEPPFEGEAPHRLGRRWGELPAAVSVQSPVPPLSPAEWARMAPGDVFVLGRRSRPPAFQAHACGRLWPLSPTPEGWRIEGPAQHLPRTQETPSMTEHQAPAEDDADKAPATGDPDATARELPVQVAFEIGRLEMPVGKLAELQPGYVFPVPAQLEGANVTIRANGEAVGEGELVSVGDTLGVRLLSWR